MQRNIPDMRNLSQKEQWDLSLLFPFLLEEFGPKAKLGKDRWTIHAWCGVGAATVAQRRVLESELNKEGICIGQLPRSEPDCGEEVVHLEEGVSASEPQNGEEGVPVEGSVLASGVRA